MNSNDSRQPVSVQIAVHIFSVSSAMVGVCLAVIGLFQLSDRLKSVENIGDELVAVDACLFLVSVLLAYFSLKSKKTKRQNQLEKGADAVFLTALLLMVLIGAFVAYTLI